MFDHIVEQIEQILLLFVLCSSIILKGYMFFAFKYNVLKNNGGSRINFSGNGTF